MHHHFHHILYPYVAAKSFSIVDFISLLANIITILGIAGLWFAYWDYKNRQKEDKMKNLTETLRAVRSVKYQLEVIGEWTNFKKGGYHEKDIISWTKKEKGIRGNPFHNIFKIEYSSLKDLTVLPAIEYFSDDINEAIAWVKQWVASFNSTLDEIKSFSLTRSAYDNIVLHLKLNKAINTKITNDEDLFMTKLTEMYAILHFQIIGDEKTKSLHYWHRKLKEYLDKLETETEEKIKGLN